MNVESGYKPIFANKTNARVRLVQQGIRATLGGIDTAYNSDDAVPLDQVLALIGGGGGGDMLAAIYDPTGQATDIFNIDNILTGNNVATQMLVFDSGGGQQAQLSDGQILVGSGPGTASMAADGTIYSSDNGSFGPEQRTEITPGVINLLTGGITTVTMDPTQAGFGDGTANINMSYTAGVANIIVTDNTAIASMAVNAGNARIGVDDGVAATISMDITSGAPVIAIVDGNNSALSLFYSFKHTMHSANYPNNFMEIDGSNGTWYLGDLNDDANGTSIDLDDAAGRIRFRSSSNLWMNVTSSGVGLQTVVELNGGFGISFLDKIGVVTPATTTAHMTIAAGGTGAAQINLATGAAPTSPQDGDMWRQDNTNTGLKIRVNGVTKTVTLA